MSSRDYIKNEIDTLPDSVIEKIVEFVTFQKFSLHLSGDDRVAALELQEASMSSISFWDNPEDEVWDHV